MSEQERSVWRGLLHTYHELERALDAELHAVHDLALSSYELLAQLCLAPEQRLRMIDLAGRLVFTRSGITRLTDRLEQQGLVERRAVDDDARGVYVVVTSKGFDLFDKARHTYVAVLRDRFFGRLREGELEQLDELWSRLRGPTRS